MIEWGSQREGMWETESRQRNLD